QTSSLVMSTKSVSLEAPGNGSLWVVQVLGALLFFLAGFAMLSGDEQMVETFAAIGIGQWFRYVTGLIEVASAILLLIPALSGIIAVLAVPMMIGAILTQLLIIGGVQFCRSDFSLLRVLWPGAEGKQL